MKLPQKIQVIDSTRSENSLLRFGDNWEGYDTKKQIIHLALRLNEILDYLKALPILPDETPLPTKQEGESVVHEHEWIEHMRLGNRGVYECRQCGQTMEKLLV